MATSPTQRAKTNPNNVAVGQHWMDYDPRITSGGRRFIEVLSVDGAYATVRSYRTHITADKNIHRVYGRTTKIRLDRFRPNQTGYKRVS